MGEMLTLLPEYSSEEFDSRHRLVIVAAQRPSSWCGGAYDRVIQVHQRNQHRARRSPASQVKFLVGKEAVTPSRNPRG